MTAGIPGAGIGGLFYLATTILLPVRNLVRRLRGHSQTAWRDQAFVVLLTGGILGALWATGWLLALVVPRQLLTRGGFSNAATGGVTATVIPIATFAVAVGTLVLVLVAVEVAHLVYAKTSARGRTTRPIR
jgi:multisubunit Na+/H+ antiporter MnhB subunit